MNRGSIMVNHPGLVNARSPQDVYVFFDDFLTPQWGATTVDLQTTWTLTDITTAGATDLITGTANTPNTGGGIISLTTNASADDGTNLIVRGAAFHVEDGYPLYYEARFMTPDVSNCDYWLGLSTVDDYEIIKGGCDDRMGFEMESGALKFTSEFAGTEKQITPAYTETDSAWIRGAFFWDGDNELKIYLDGTDNGEFDHVGTLKADVTADYLCTDTFLTPSIEVITGTTASAEILYVDYVYCAQQRYHS